MNLDELLKCGINDNFKGKINKSCNNIKNKNDCFATYNSFDCFKNKNKIFNIIYNCYVTNNLN